MDTPKACPGWERFKNLSSFECKCPECGKTKEIFSDEFEKEHYCPGCHQKIDFSKCTFSGSGKSA
jgi:rubredoxin